MVVGFGSKGLVWDRRCSACGDNGYGLGEWWRCPMLIRVGVSRGCKTCIDRVGCWELVVSLW